jgi:hypothetical protein
MRKQHKLLFASVAALAIAAAPALALPSGTYSITNNASVDVNLTANTFTTGGYTNSFPSTIAHGASPASGSASSASDTLIGAVSYQDPATNFGCKFETRVTKVGSNYTFSFTPSVLGGSGSTAVCTMPGSGTAATGAFSSSPAMSGF